MNFRNKGRDQNGDPINSGQRTEFFKVLLEILNLHIYICCVLMTIDRCEKFT